MTLKMGVVIYIRAMIPWASVDDKVHFPPSSAQLSCFLRNLKFFAPNCQTNCWSVKSILINLEREYYHSLQSCNIYHTLLDFRRLLNGLRLVPSLLIQGNIIQLPQRLVGKNVNFFNCFAPKGQGLTHFLTLFWG